MQFVKGHVVQDNIEEVILALFKIKVTNIKLSVYLFDFEMKMNKDTFEKKIVYTPFVYFKSQINPGE